LVSVAEDLGGEGSPSTDGLGGAEVCPELLGGWSVCGAVETKCCRLTIVVDFFSGGSYIAGVGVWFPRHVWHWWDGWCLWWAEEGGEGVSFGIFLEEGDVVIPHGLGGVVGALAAHVQFLLGVSGCPDGLGDLGWEESGDSQVELNCIDNTEVRVTDGGGTTCGGGGDGGVWDVDDVTVLLALGGGEITTNSFSVSDWALAWGQPGGWELGVRVDKVKCSGFSVPGSEGWELLGWHGESWDEISFL